MLHFGFWNYWRLAVLAIPVQEADENRQARYDRGVLISAALGNTAPKRKLERCTSHVTNPGKPDGIEGCNYCSWDLDLWMIVVVWPGPDILCNRLKAQGKPDTVEQELPIALRGKIGPLP